MCSKKDLEEALSKIPPEYPYEVVANLREGHHLFHLGNKIDEGVPHSFTSVEDLIHVLMNFEPTTLVKALDLWKRTMEITEDNLAKPGNSEAMRLLYVIYNAHVPQEKINHAY